MDAFPFVQAMLSEPALRVLLSDNFPVDVHSEILKWFIEKSYFNEFFEKYFNPSDNPSDNPSENLHDELPGDVEFLRVKFRQLGYAIREIIQLSSRSHSLRSKLQSILAEWRDDRNWFSGYMKCMVKSIETEGVLELKDRDAVLNSVDDIKGIEDLLPDKADSSYCFTNKEKCRALFLMTVFPALCEMKEPVEILWFLLDLSIELDNLPELICEACEGQPLAILLIGTLISPKPRDYDTWAKVKDDLDKIKKSDYGDSDDNPNHGRLAKLLEELEMEKTKESDSDSSDSDNGATNHLPRHIFTYCFSDLTLSLQSCLLYLACYPIDYEIPARSLIEIWIAERFIAPEEGETLEETAYKYLEQLVERLWVRVSKRSLLGTIKCCRVRQPIHELIIKESWRDGFLAANPDAKKNIKSFTRLAIHHGNKCVFPDKVYSWGLRSFLAFDCDWGLPLHPDWLRVLELNKSPIPVLWNCEHGNSALKYVRLRGSKIYDLPKYIGRVYKLQTLDIRDTSIETLPEYIWNIETLRHVYVNPSPQIKGPPPEANIPNLQILKTVGVPESWLEIDKFSGFLINLRKLALSNTNSPDCKSNPFWKPISILLSRMDHLISMAITGDFVPPEFVDCRAFPNLKTVMSIKLEGKWTICRKLFIDNVEFPPNLRKLTLTKSGLKEDPMPRLERLQALKFLSLQDGVYTGDQMVCSANGFPQLQIMELKKLNLKNLEVKPTGMSLLATLRVDLCPNLKIPHHLEHVTTYY
ncbi:putative disease resistance RPP8-like protein 2 [Carex rostrata]